MKQVQKGTKLPFPFEYINEISALKKIKQIGYDVSEVLDIGNLMNAIALRSGIFLTEIALKQSQCKLPSRTMENELFA